MPVSVLFILLVGKLPVSVTLSLVKRTYMARSTCDLPGTLRAGRATVSVLLKATPPGQRAWHKRLNEERNAESVTSWFIFEGKELAENKVNFCKTNI